MLGFTLSFLLIGLPLIVLTCAIELSILSWNIQHGCPCETMGCIDPIHICSCDCEISGSANFSTTIRALSGILTSYNITVASIQEIDSMTIRSGPPPINESSQLCSDFPPDGCLGEASFLMTPLITGGLNGIGTYSTVPLVHSQTLFYNDTCNSELTANGHGVLATQIFVTEDTPVWIFNVHAPGGALPTQTQCQAEELIAFANELTDKQQDLHFIMGDYNADPLINPLYYETMSSLYVDSYTLKCSLPNDNVTPQGHTRPTGNLTSPEHGMRIDYIWIPKSFASQISCVRYDTPNIGLISDHLPVVLQLEYTRTT